jgi:hypothetical protein
MSTRDDVKIIWRGPYHPRKLVKEHSVHPKTITWLTTAEDPEYRTNHPSDLAKLNMELCDAQQRLRPEIKHLHFGRGAIDILMAYNGYDTVLRFFNSLSDKAVVSGCVITANMDPRASKAGDYAKLIRDGKFTEMDTVEQLKAETEDTSRQIRLL